MRCNYCEWRCDLGKRKLGVCRMYMQKEGTVRERFPHRWSTCGTSRMESIPFYHAYPDTRCMVIGTTGCNLSCRYCSNAFVAKEDPERVQDRTFELSPAEIIRKARQMGCDTIVFNVNEPAMSLPSLAELSLNARNADIPMGCLTNGYTTEGSTEMLGSIFSFFNVGLKGLSDMFHKQYIGIPSSKPVLRNIKMLAAKHHVEVTTPVIQSANDHELEGIARFIAEVDPEIPWHVFRLLPEDEMKDARYPNIDAIDRVLESARRMLSYVYFHNFVGSNRVNTLCPQCGSVVIERFSLGCGGDRLRAFRGRDGRCPGCGKAIRLLGGGPARGAGEVMS